MPHITRLQPGSLVRLQPRDGAMMLRLVPGSPPTLASPWPRMFPWDSPTLSPTDQHRLAVCRCRVCSRIANAGLRGSTLHPPSIPLPLWLLHGRRSCALLLHRKHRAQGQDPCMLCSPKRSPATLAFPLLQKLCIVAAYAAGLQTRGSGTGPMHGHS
jgi:hypothetical protein